MDKKKSILYIDDEEINLKLFEYNFSKEYNVITAYSGAEGLDYLTNNPEIEVVISDMRMPQMSGLEFVEIANKEFSQKKYFILSGYDISEEIKSAIKLNLIQNYFRKPFNYNEINRAIEEVV